MTERKLGFLGCGSMAECIMAGLLKSSAVKPENVFVCNRTASKNDHLVATYNVTSVSPEELASKADIVLLGTKPYGVVPMLEVIKGKLNPQTIVISMAAGVPIATIENHCPPSTKVIRVMPNVPSFVGEGVTSVSCNSSISQDEETEVLKLFGSIGKAYVVAESAIHGVVGVAGSSPAYVFMFLEALSDGAVRGGVPRALSYEMAAQAVLGAAKMLQESDKTPAALKDMVCSPGGTTIEAVRYLEKGGFRSAVIEGMIQCMEKSKEFEKVYSE
ncbi:Pyrroline-5-carboxylate reductase [Leptomonas pyrrhocoris]|uniref:Pyrroline-5-carboxylate reductase n=1 Tax=Leptomonas pyrrhocoris TaxID=157538 RepID=A0A0M9FUP3_LEPPY|nr:Pyrroline-5-carboxylate reductase [Leptomonas pyrrhocoris]KPA76327.1 Pyrroline-5-carboxylate reductase [Leptomonas pyrrhocoris]|eukprot:XP_015654766.1 Pyrroline-5-carboxylate reductase [Leptomonas pyrrhocoris]